MSQPTYAEYEAEVQRPTGRYSRKPATPEQLTAFNKTLDAGELATAKRAIAQLEAELENRDALLADYATENAKLRAEHDGRIAEFNAGSDAYRQGQPYDAEPPNTQYGQWAVGWACASFWPLIQKNLDLTAELAELRTLYADRDRDLKFEYERANAAEAQVKKLREDLRDAALTDYSTGSLTTYTPAVERLILAGLPY